VILAYVDWLVHLGISPAKQFQLMEKAVRKSLRFGLYTTQYPFDRDTEPCVEPLPQDKRFALPAWQRWPYNLFYQGFLLNQQWWWNATTGVRGVSQHHENVVWFTTRQWLDVFSPANYLFTNPEISKATVREGGANLVRGALNFLEDTRRHLEGKSPVGAENFKVGEQVAVTPGKVVYRNRLIELIQYAPTTDEVQAEPILIVPAWIMKYYILDLSPHNSLVKYLRDQGHTVFMISWKNPDHGDRNLGMADYRTLGVMAALDAISAIVAGRKVHAVGYCLGGTLLSVTAAVMARAGDKRLQTISLLAAQVDFDDAGELMLFIDDSQVAYIKDLMWSQGYLEEGQMAGAFQLLRSNDLIWSRLVHDYLLGKRQPMFDLMAWNADTTRMPYRMHSEYLEKLFLNNDLSRGRMIVDGRHISITDIRAPIFSVATEKDHVSPWRSVYKVNILTDTDVTFLLTSGGHNAGVVSEPGHKGRYYRVATKHEPDHYVDPDTWRERTPVHKGSWWIEWHEWLVERSSGPVKPPAMGAPRKRFNAIREAPGEYVFG